MKTQRGCPLNKPVFKFAQITTVCISAIFAAACQTTAPTLGQKDPEKAVQVRTQVGSRILKKWRLRFSQACAWIKLWKAIHVIPSANMMMGVLLQQEGSKLNLEKADAYFKRAIAADPKNAQARNNYGTYLYQVERYNEAIEQLSIAGATLGYDQRFRALENVGRIYLKLGDIANAEKSFKQALQANRDSYVSMLELSEILYLRQQFAPARQLYEQFVRAVGQKNQGARALWIGIRLARANGDQLGTQVLVKPAACIISQ